MEKDETFLSCRWSPAPVKDQKTIFFLLELFIVETQFEINKFLLKIFISPKIWVGCFVWSVLLVPKTLDIWREKVKRKHG